MSPSHSHFHFLDDVTIGVENILHALTVIIEPKALGLALNDKSEIISEDKRVGDMILHAAGHPTGTWLGSPFDGVPLLMT